MSDHDRRDQEAINLANSHGRHDQARREQRLIDTCWTYTVTIIGLLLVLWVARETGALIGALAA